MKAVTLHSKGTYLVNGVPAETAAIPAEEARREHTDPLADRTVAGVPGVNSAIADPGDAPRTEEPLDLPADDPRRGYR